jgi:hypothetical protein
VAGIEVNETVETAELTVTVAIDSKELKGLLENWDATVPNIGLMR